MHERIQSQNPGRQSDMLVGRLSLRLDTSSNSLNDWAIAHHLSDEQLVT
jgi:hypothetical protein